jgi:hypothetical protein
VTVADEQATTRGGGSRLALQGELTGLAVEEAALIRRVFPVLAAALPDGFAADPATLRLDLEPGAGDGAFVVTARATGRAQLDPAALAAQLAGQLPDAAAALNALPWPSRRTLTWGRGGGGPGSRLPCAPSGSN